MRHVRARKLSHRLAAGIRRERRRKGWTQEEAAEACGLNPRHFQRLEAGEMNATLTTIEQLGAAFGVDVRRLFEP